MLTGTATREPKPVEDLPACFSPGLRLLEVKATLTPLRFPLLFNSASVM